LANVRFSNSWTSDVGLFVVAVVAAAAAAAEVVGDDVIAGIDDGFFRICKNLSSTHPLTQLAFVLGQRWAPQMIRLFKNSMLNLPNLILLHFSKVKNSRIQFRRQMAGSVPLHICLIWIGAKAQQKASDLQIVL
jgi:hypothetical protein